MKTKLQECLMDFAPCSLVSYYYQQCFFTSMPGYLVKESAKSHYETPLTRVFEPQLIHAGRIRILAPAQQV